MKKKKVKKLENKKKEKGIKSKIKIMNKEGRIEIRKLSLIIRVAHGQTDTQTDRHTQID